MKLNPKIAFSLNILCAIGMVFLFGTTVLAQKIDTAKITIKPKAKIVSKVPVIKADIIPYKPRTLGYGSQNAGAPASTAPKNGRIITILKVYPNPITGEQINISFRLDRETAVTIKITDLLSNDVITLANERMNPGEQTRTFPIPSRLNPGFYFLKINAGGAPAAAKITVL